jgi:beta-N-acetylhexosaminidase
VLTPPARARSTVQAGLAALAAAVVMTTAGAAQTAPTARITRLIETLPLEKRVGQLVMPWLLGNYVGFDAEGLAQARFWLDSLSVGGIIISIGSPMDVAGKINFLQRRSKLPLLIAADLEGGAAFRFPGATPFPTNMGIGATGRVEDAATMGRITALEARAVGVHLNFGPVADINNNPANPIINTRSFGGDPVQVARMVASNVRATKAAGLLATVKHFPGHGDTEVDSHISLPVIRADWERLRTLELIPFAAAVKAGVDAVMSAHIALPGLDGDSTRPATLSAAVLTGILRDSLEFGGLVITDALDMGALVATYGGGEAAVRAFEAGSDLLLMPANPREAIAAMVNAVRSGRISAARLRQSLVRVLEIKERLGLFDRRTISLERVGAVVGQRKFLESARSIAARSLVLVRDSGGVVSRLRASPGDLALVSYGDAGWATTLPQQLTRRAHKVRAFRLYPMSGPASYDSARALLELAPVSVFSVAVKVSSGSGTIAMPPALADLVEGASRVRPTLLVSFGSPYLAAQAPSVSAFLLGWTNTAQMEDVVGSALSGAPITGRLPIDLPPRYRIGDGLILPVVTRFDVTNRR